ncbi:replication-relaxation family protein [Peribacillus frigoritolerans]|uniref:replication-relaxation family protein n=1 Tax=Peribacillus frigoritolerans TaxID=450367 RepID=UPI0039A251DB
MDDKHVNNASLPPSLLKKKGQAMRYITLREEDRQLLLHLHSFIYLHRSFIEKYIFHTYENIDSVYRRLRTLEEAGYVKAFMLPINDFDHRPSKVYTLTMFGAEIVEQMRGVVHWNRRWTTQVPPWYQHQLMIAELVKSYELKASEHGLEVKEWITEARAFYEFRNLNEGKKNGKNVIRPDGIIVIGKPGSDQNMGIMLEMERSYATREKTLRKMEQFNEFFSRREELLPKYDKKIGFEYPVKGWKILFIGGNEAKTLKILRDLKGEEENAEVPVMVANRQEANMDPFGEIYRYLTRPNEKKKL